jgi:hypothetical protein
MRLVLTVINILSAVPVLAYPALFVAGIMSFDAPGSDKSLSTWVIFIACVGYPLFIVLFIVISQIYLSTTFALVGLVPMLVFGYIFFVSGGTAQKENFNTLHKDFVCDSNSFLSLGGNETNPIRSLVLLERRNFFTYKNSEIATVFGNKWIKAERINSKDVRDKTDALLNSCKNVDGKTAFQTYEKIERERVKEILKLINEESK